MSPITAFMHQKFLKQREERKSADSRMAKKGSTIQLFDALIAKHTEIPSIEEDFFNQCEKYCDGYIRGMS